MAASGMSDSRDGNVAPGVGDESQPSAGTAEPRSSSTSIESTAAQTTRTRTAIGAVTLGPEDAGSVLRVTVGTQIRIVLPAVDPTYVWTPLETSGGALVATPHRSAGGQAGGQDVVLVAEGIGVSKVSSTLKALKAPGVTGTYKPPPDGLWVVTIVVVDD